MFLKVHHTQTAGDIIAVCDRELINTTVMWNDIKVFISEHFYGNTMASEEEVRSAMLLASCINLMGKRAFALARELDLVDEKSYVLIGDIPHAQIFRI